MRSINYYNTIQFRCGQTAKYTVCSAGTARQAREARRLLFNGQPFLYKYTRLFGYIVCYINNLSSVY